MEIVVTRGDGRRDSLVIHLARAVYVFSQAFVDVSLRASISHLLFVVEFDFRDEQSRKAARILMQTLLIFADFDGEVLFCASPVTARRTERRNVLRRRRRRIR